MAETAADRLARMLALVPYISRRPGVGINDLAAEFGVSNEQLAADLNLLMVCGLPGYYPDDLIDVVLDDDGGTVAIAFDAGIERPVRLTADEAFALTVALRALAELPGLVDAEAVHSALAKLAQLGGRAAADTDAVRVVPADPAPALGVVRQALDETRRIWIRYYTASRDQVTERTVDPLRLLVTDGHSYLEAYCHLAGAIRHFRVDRIDEVRLLDEPAQATLWVDSDIPERIFHPDPQIPPVTLTLSGGARWVAEYYPMDEITELAEPAGALRVRMRANGDEWLARLVLSLGGEAVIEDRPELVGLVAERAEQALAQYH
ncbi:MAG: YafY family protein [Nakamurella sp.]